MKKRILWLLTLGMLLSLCACENAPLSTPERETPDSESSTNPTIAKEEENSVASKEDDNVTSGPISLLSYPQSGHTGCATEDGFYYLSDDEEPLADGRYTTHLMYMDFAAKQEIYLCSNAACSHDTENCTSVFVTEDFPVNSTLLFVWDDHLYIMSKEQDHSGSVTMEVMGEADTDVVIENRPTMLYRANLDGTEREKIVTFDSTVTVEDFVVGDAGGLYVITKKVTTRQSNGSSYQTSSERNLMYLDLSAETESVICSMDFGDDIAWDVIGCSDRLLVLYGIDFGREVSPEEIHDEDTKIYDDSYDVFATLDIDSGSINEFYRVHAPKARGYVVDENHLYFSVYGDGQIAKVDLRTGEETTLCMLTQDALGGMIGDRLFCYDDNGCTYYFVDVNTGEVSHCGLVNKTTGWNLEFIAEASDQVLVIYDSEGTFQSDGSFSPTRDQYGLIDREDLYAGIEDYTSIIRVGKGQ